MGSRKQEESQKQVFYLLYGFALRISTRYTSIKNQPDQAVYEAFNRLFKNWNRYSFLSEEFLKEKLKNILIETCVEREIKEYRLLNYLPGLDDKEIPFSVNDFQTLPEKYIIDALRSLPFILRYVYNMYIIDELNEGDIASLLYIPSSSVLRYITIARQHLNQLLPPGISGSEKLKVNI
jgi:DNA-directed RNA polymerase specialized sigma24 family protein